MLIQVGSEETLLDDATGLPRGRVRADVRLWRSAANDSCMAFGTRISRKAAERSQCRRIYPGASFNEVTFMIRRLPKPSLLVRSNRCENPRVTGHDAHQHILSF
jgi:hypothetical protein